MNRKHLAFGVVAIIIASVLVYNQVIRAQQFTGTITVSGAWALYPMMVRWAEEYQKIRPGMKIEISAGGAGKGMADALSGLVDIGMVSREIYQAEIDKGAFWVSVVKDAVVATVNKNNPVIEELLAKGVTKSDLAGIYIYGNITTWGQLLGKPEETGTINVYTRSDSCGAAETWAKYLGKKQEDLKGVGVYGDPGLAEAVKGDALGIGYNNINYAYDSITGEPIEGMAIIPLDINENGQVDRNENFYGTKAQIIEAISVGNYPSPPARELNLVAKEKFSSLASEFVRWILTDGQQFALETGYVPLSEERRAEELSKL